MNAYSNPPNPENLVKTSTMDYKITHLQVRPLKNKKLKYNTFSWQAKLV